MALVEFLWRVRLPSPATLLTLATAGTGNAISHRYLTVDEGDMETTPRPGSLPTSIALPLVIPTSLFLLTTPPSSSFFYVDFAGSPH